ncbi:MAG: Fur family transcriptional regulator [Nanoarchaeota archaeon]|nr:transcriptional repressor [Nanoarchaeota archaeon]MBU1030148.1 transcriptional repressor [Nanoarchaeota archaeon]MBU1850424.1 transcriptional repressor [Nanoarchaeota archaeon]
MITRITNQRLKILDFMKNIHTHPTAEIVYNAVKKDLPAITLATVYRNLNLLARQGVILRFEINGEYHYDADMCSHQHGICKKCGKIVDIHQGELSEYAIKNFKSNDFRAECVNIMFKGLCKECIEVRK